MRSTVIFIGTLFAFFPSPLVFCFQNTNFQQHFPAAQISETKLKNLFERDLIEETRNKEFVVRFYKKVFGERNVTGIENFFGDNYIQHNPNYSDGKDGFVRKLKSIFPEGSLPFQRLKILNVVAEGDLVWLHVLNNVAPKPNPTQDAVVVDIYRVKDGVLVEHFDVIQPIPLLSFNPHPMINGLEQQYQQKCTFGRIPPATS